MPTFTKPYPTWYLVTADDQIVAYTVRSCAQVKRSTRRNVRYYSEERERFYSSNDADWFETIGEARIFRVERLELEIHKARDVINELRARLQKIRVEEEKTYGVPPT